VWKTLFANPVTYIETIVTYIETIQKRETVKTGSSGEEEVEGWGDWDSWKGSRGGRGRRRKEAVGTKALTLFFILTSEIIIMSDNLIYAM